ncbi:hypothetical protein E4U42_006195 [Claviceps africana]|uniref:CYB2-lactate dehydrogenase cytochrome b2 n=1 Tax=Claviceps africana TaxID=83212 RepID=A0A8K0J8R0_9HYPO|nr:hypothetical protein E4U42_006195 [Claviceps africana]
MVKKVSALDVLLHDRPDDAWLVIHGDVYDVTEFAFPHPGGEEILHRYAGKDASAAYDEVHAPSLIRSSLDSKYHLGKLDQASVTEAWIAAKQSNVRPEHNVARPPLRDIISIHDFERAAKSSFTDKAWAYIHGASNDNITRDANTDILKRIWLRPSVMKNVGKVSTQSTLFGCSLDLPLCVSPAGAAKTAVEEGELAFARGAGPSGIIHCIATPASYPHAEILEATPRHAFFQLYVNKDRAKSAKLLREISASEKVKAIFVTVDLPVVSKREDDERVKSRSTSEKEVSDGTDDKGAGLARQSGAFIDPSLSWDDVAWIRRQTHLPIVLKGLQRWEDVQIAMKYGCAGVVVSNHGGRAADTAQPSVITLLELHKNCPEVFAAMRILVDGGFRRGSDVVKAVCLGASAVGMGRPFMYAVNYGSRGVEHAIKVLKDEVATAMQLCGMTDLFRDASADFLNTCPVDHLVVRGPHPYVGRFVHPKAKI